MSGWSVTEESVKALETMAKDLGDHEAAIKNERSKLEQVYEQNKDGLGPHSDSIAALIEEIKRLDEEASRPVKILVLKLTKAALLRRATLEKNRYTNIKGRSR